MTAHIRSGRILLIESTAGLAGVLRRTLAHHHFTVTSCTDFGGAALSLLSEHTFDLILLHGGDAPPAGDGRNAESLEWGLAQRDAEILTGKQRTLNTATPLFAILTDDAGPAADRARQMGATRIFRLLDVSPGQLLAAVEQQLPSMPMVV